MDPKAAIIARLRAEGFEIARVTRPEQVTGTRERLGEWLSSGFHGTMGWMEDRKELRGHSHDLWPEVRSIIVCGSNYGPDYNPLDLLERRKNGLISAYALNRDYHDVMKGKLKNIAGWFASVYSCDVKVFVDTAPVMEKPLAQSAGIGWQGKHTNIVSQEFGSWLFLGEIFSTLALDEDQPEIDHCGSCARCLEICPTRAFPRPYVLDARKCISYLTIEHKGPIPTRFRQAIGNRIYGCDDCLSICPWNKFAKVSSELSYKAREGMHAPNLVDLLKLDDAAFRKLFSRSPVKRIGRDRFIRNVLIACGNSNSREFVDPMIRLLDDISPVVRGAAVWSLGQLLQQDRFHDLKEKYYMAEVDLGVRLEWEREEIVL